MVIDTQARIKADSIRRPANMEAVKELIFLHYGLVAVAFLLLGYYLAKAGV